MTKRQSTARKRARAAARQGAKYTQALHGRAVVSPTPDASAPAVPAWDGSSQHDVNPVCGHNLCTLCGSCGVCTRCDSCYCAELAEDAATDVSIERDYEEHIGHEEHRADCYLCEDDREESAGYTRCPKCGLPYPDGRPDHIAHGIYCRPLPRYRIGVDWSYLIGQRATFVGRDYSVHGLVLAEPHPGATPAHPYLWMRRTDAGYEDGSDGVSPINPREWLDVRPAPSA